MRMQGPELWLLVNDQPILSVSDGALTTGTMWVSLLRTGDPGDPQESAVVVRNLRLSGLAEGDQARHGPGEAAGAGTSPRRLGRR